MQLQYRHFATYVYNLENVVVKLASTPMVDTHDTEFVNWLLTPHLFKPSVQAYRFRDYPVNS